MKRFLMLVALLLPVAATAYPQSEYWVIVNGAVGGQYPSSDAACQAYYSGYVMQFWTLAGWPVGPYEAPYETVDVRAPNAKSVMCPATVQFPPPSGWVRADTLARREINCEAGSTYNPGIGKCQASTEDQAQNETGDPARPSPGVVVTCAGDPVNTPTGNVFEAELDYASGDRELAFSRFYTRIAEQ